ncbi:MAG: hypothetical protein P5684_22745, partial [Limnospira sp. PMC 1238.20]|uniref:beta strand repeat-containing protein n=1 Tax=unclassified Limnospira TaxID=2642885 RepID=UPI0028E105EC
TGTFTFVSEAGLISVSGTDVSASLGLGGTAVTVSNALFGLNLLADGTYALYAEGTAALTGIPALTLSGDLAVRANTTGLQTASFSDFADPVDFGTPDPFFAFRGTGLSLAIDGFVTLSGDFTFVSVPDSLSVTGLNVSASLSAGTVSASVTEATLGMALFADGTYALYAAGTAALSGIPALTLSGTLAVWANTTGQSEITFPDFAEPVDFGTAAPFFALRGTALTLAIDGFASLSGDFTFVSVPDSLSLTGSSIEAALSAGPVSVSVSGGTLAMVLFADGTYALNAEGTAALSGIPALTLSGALAVRANTSGLAAITFPDLAAPVDFGTPDPLFDFRGDNLLLSIDNFVTLSGGLRVTLSGGQLDISGSSITAVLAAGSAAATVSDAEFALSLRADGTYALYALGTASLSGIPGLSLSGTLAVWANTTGDAVVSLGGFGDIDFGTSTDFFALRGSSLTLAIDGFVTLSGSLTLIRVPGSLSVTGSGIQASLGAGGVAVSLSEGSLALLLNADGTYALEADGLAALTGVPQVSLSGTLRVRANTTGTAEVDFGNGVNIDFGTAAELFSVEGSDLTLAVANFVSLSGSFAFALRDNELTAIGSGLSAGLEISGDLFVRVTGASFGLVAGSGNLVFEARGSTVDAALPGASLTAASVQIRYSTANGSVAADETLSIGSQSFSFSESIAAGTLVFELSDAELAVLGLLSLEAASLRLERRQAADGSFGLQAAATGIAFTVGVNGTHVLDFSNGEGALWLSDAGVAASLSGSVALLDGVIPGLSISAGTFTVSFSNISTPVNESISTGSGTLSLVTPAGPYLQLRAEDLSIGLLGQSLTGDIGFQRYLSGSDEILIVAFRNISLSFNGEGSGGDPVAIASAQGAFVVRPGSGLAGFLEFDAEAGFGDFDAGARVSLFINNLNEAIDEEGPFGRIVLAARGPGDAELWLELALSFNFPGLTLSGTFSVAANPSSGGATVVVGVDVSVFVGDNSQPGNLRGLQLLNGTGVFVQNGGIMSGEIRGEASLIGIDGISFTSQVTLRYHAGELSLSDSFTVGGQTVNLTFSDSEVAVGSSAFIQILAENSSLNIGDAFSLSGDFAFTRDGEGFVVTGSDTQAFIGYGPLQTSAGLENPQAVGIAADNLSFGLAVRDNGTMALTAQGSARVIGVPGLTLSGSLQVQANTTGASSFDFGGSLGDVNFGSSDPLFRFSGSNLSLGIDGFVSLSGDFSFEQDSSSLVITAQNVHASLGAGGVEARVNNASLGLAVFANATYALVAGGEAELLGVPGVSLSGSLAVEANTSGQQSPVIGALGAVDFGSSANRFELRGETLSLGIDGFASLSGSYTLSLENGELVLSGEGISSSLSAGAVSLTVSEGIFGMKIFEDGRFALYAEGEVALAGISALSLSGRMGIWVNRSGEAVQTLGRAGEIDFGTAADLQRFRGENLTLDIEDFVSLSGTFTFSASAGELVATGESITASLGAGGVAVSVSEAGFGLRIFENQTYALYAEGVAELTGVPGVSLSGTLAVWANTSGQAIVTLGALGPIDYGTTAERFAFRGSNLIFAIDGFAALTGTFTFVSEAG